MKSKIETVHSILLQQLEYIDRLCRKHGIEYSLYAGTLLGAIRQNGFISWDDDADIAMTRPNFEKFLEAHSLENGDIQVERDGLWVYRCKTNAANPIEGIDYENTCTDIFIFDVAPESRFLFLSKVTLLLFIQAMIKPLRYSRKDNFVWNITQIVPSLIGRCFSYGLKIKLYDRVAQWGRANTRSLYLHSSNDQFKYMPHRYKTGPSHAHVDRLFEQRMLMVLEQWEDILIGMYGPDYLTPPPESERVPMHSLK